MDQNETQHAVSRANYIQQRNKLLKDKNIDTKVIHKAWFTLSHILISENSTVADMGCGEGEKTYAMAVLYPQVNFIGIDNDKRKINKAKISYTLPNLSFKHADVSKSFTGQNSFDAIINAHVLHEIYSAAGYNNAAVTDTLEQHFKMLKTNGLMYIQDCARPPPEEFVLLEMPDKESAGKKIDQLSEPDLLVWYAEHARPRRDSGTGGFFLDELPERTPGTRLFRLPYKWAYEFIMRKDDRQHWEQELPIEYTYFTQQEFRRTIRNMGARASYTAPNWDEDYIGEHFSDKFKILRDDGAPMGYPATSFIAVARNVGERKSLLIHERRPSHTDESTLKIQAMRDEKSGTIVDVVSRNEHISEIIPYHVDSETGRLKVYLHDGIARSIANAVPRNGISIDDRRWSGHMLEPIAVETTNVPTGEDLNPKGTASFSKKYLGLTPSTNHILKQGPEYFPAPDFIDDLIHTYYLQVEKSKTAFTPKPSLIGTEKFQEKGQIREVDAQQVLDAIMVGKIPSARLEMQLLYLFNYLNIKSENWGHKQIAWKIGEVKQKTKLKDIMDNYGIADTRFKDIKGTAGQLRSVHSIFVEEGQSKGATTGLSSKDLDFVVHNDQTINTAVVLPLTKGLKNDVHAGFNLKQMPIPQRHTGNANIISAPSFNLPANITNIKLAKEYIAEKMGVMPEMVIKMGESYFSHIGMTQQKIHPFAVMIPDGKPKDPGTQFIPFYQFMLLRKSLSKHTHFMVVLARAYKYFHQDIRMDFARRVSPIVQERFEQAKPEWSLPLTFEPSPIDIIKGLDYETPKPENKIQKRLDFTEAKKPSEAVRKEIPKPEKPKVGISKDTNIQLSEEFEHEFEQFVEVLEQTLPKLDFDR